MEDLIAQPTRQKIVGVVREHPGASARDVQRLAGLAWGETAYHLDQLLRAGALRRERGGRRDYYFPVELTWDERRLFLALRSDTERRLLLELADAPGLTLAELQARADASLSTASFHLRRLLDLGLVESTRDGNLRRYRLLEADRVRAFATTYRSSFRDRVVDRFVAAWSGMLR